MICNHYTCGDIYRFIEECERRGVKSVSKLWLVDAFTPDGRLTIAELAAIDGSDSIKIFYLINKLLRYGIIEEPIDGFVRVV